MPSDPTVGLYFGGDAACNVIIGAQYATVVLAEEPSTTDINRLGDCDTSRGSSYVGAPQDCVCPFLTCINGLANIVTGTPETYPSVYDPISVVFIVA